MTGQILHFEKYNAVIFPISIHPDGEHWGKFF